jgi:L-lactate dehydrogenase
VIGTKCWTLGSTSGFALVMNGLGREIVFVDVNRARAQAEANDILDAVPFAHPLLVRAGEYADLVDSQVVIIAVGVSQRPGETRLQLLQRNAAVFEQVIPSIVEHAREAVLVFDTHEQQALHRSASILRDAVESLKLR